MVKKCKRCGKDFNAHFNQQYCSKDCLLSRVTCAYCKKKTLVSNSRARSKKKIYCSRDCYYKGNSGKNNIRYSKFERKCSYCKKTVYKKKSFLKKTKRSFCNRECFVLYLKKNVKGRKPVDKEKKRIYNKEYRRKNKKKISIQVKAYQLRNREKILKKKKEYRIANKEKLSIEMKAWREKNKHKATIYTNNRRARKKGNGGTYTIEDWNNLKEKYNYTCLCCGKKEPLVEITVDHVLPLSKGGDNSLENLQPLCRQCNMEKGTKEIDYRKS